MTHKVYDTWGFLIYLDTNESGMMKARANETYEVSKFTWMEKNLRNTDTFVDVGANKGDFSLHAARFCKNVYSIEPHPENLMWLRKSILLNEFQNIEVIEGCATTHSGLVDLSIGVKSGYHSLMRKSAESISVNAFRLDDVISGDSLVLKIDVEGAEKLVLEGAQNILKRTRAILLDLDSGDMEGVKALLPNHGLVNKRGNDLLFVTKHS